NLSSSSNSSSLGTSPTPFLAITTISTLGKSCCFKRKASRVTRLTLLRQTARLRAFLSTANPRRRLPSSFALARSLRCGEAARTGLSKTFLKCAGVNKRNSREKSCRAIRRLDGHDLWRDEQPVPYGHLQWLYEHENRGCACALNLKVDKCVS